MNVSTKLLRATAVRRTHLWPNEVGVGWLCCPGIVWEPSREMSSNETRQGTLGHSCLSSLSQWEWSWPKKWNARADLHLGGKKKAQAGYEWSSPQILASEEKDTTTTIGNERFSVIVKKRFDFCQTLVDKTFCTVNQSELYWPYFNFCRCCASSFQKRMKKSGKIFYLHGLISKINVHSL